MSSSIATPPSPAATPSRGPFRLAIAILVATAVTILWGALTTSTGSGMAYADWPLSNGHVMPESSYTTLPGFLEHFHRLFASSVGLMALALWILLLRDPTANRAQRVAAFVGGLLVLVQGVFGGVGVLLNLPTFTSVTHATLAQLTLATFGCVAYLLSSRYRRTAPVTSVAPGSGRRLATVALVALLLQTVLGAIARHANSDHALWTHVGNAFVVFLLGTVATAFAIGRLAEVPGIKGLSRTIVLLLIVQIALGFVALAVRSDAGKQPENVDRLGAAITISLHVLIGALLTSLTAALVAHVYRATRRPRSDDPSVVFA